MDASELRRVHGNGERVKKTVIYDGDRKKRAHDALDRVLDRKRARDAGFKPGDKVWANPIGRSGGTVKGTVARINSSGQVVIESGGREHEFHPSNVHVSDAKSAGDASRVIDRLMARDELWTPNHSNPVPAGWRKLSREAMKLAGEAQAAAAKYDKNWDANKALFAALRRMNEAQNKGDEVKLRKEAAAVMSEAASKRA